MKDSTGLLPHWTISIAFFMLLVSAFKCIYFLFLLFSVNWFVCHSYRHFPFFFFNFIIFSYSPLCDIICLFIMSNKIIYFIYIQNLYLYPKFMFISLLALRGSTGAFDFQSSWLLLKVNDITGYDGAALPVMLFVCPINSCMYLAFSLN